MFDWRNQTTGCEWHTLLLLTHGISAHFQLYTQTNRRTRLCVQSVHIYKDCIYYDCGDFEYWTIILYTLHTYRYRYVFFFKTHSTNGPTQKLLVIVFHTRSMHVYAIVYSIFSFYPHRVKYVYVWMDVCRQAGRHVGMHAFRLRCKQPSCIEWKMCFVWWITQVFSFIQCSDIYYIPCRAVHS